MTQSGSWIIAIGAAVMIVGGPGLAQEPPSAQTPSQQTPGDADPAAINPDESADYLNAQQQVKQSFTVTRTINGEVVETDKRTILYSRSDPVRPTEAGVSPLEALRAAFDREVLTRTEAFEEAKLDFVIADQNRDDAITADEFVTLVANWRDDTTRDMAPTDEETARERQYRAFIEELDPGAAQAEMEARAREKFAFMAGMSNRLTREDYIREYLLDFDSMDMNDDMILRADELLRFRAANRGERLAEDPKS